MYLDFFFIIINTFQTNAYKLIQELLITKELLLDDVKWLVEQNLV